MKFCWVFLPAKNGEFTRENGESIGLMGFDGEHFFCLPGLLRGFAPTAGPARSLWAKLQQVHDNFDFISKN